MSIGDLVKLSAQNMRHPVEAWRIWRRYRRILAHRREDEQDRT